MRLRKADLDALLNVLKWGCLRWTPAHCFIDQVLLKAVIDKNGAIQELQVISGHPMLLPAALDAVKQWRYRPFLLNSQPIEVETQITVTFRFSS